MNKVQIEFQQDTEHLRKLISQFDNSRLASLSEP